MTARFREAIATGLAMVFFCIATLVGTPSAIADDCSSSLPNWLVPAIKGAGFNTSGCFSNPEVRESQDGILDTTLNVSYANSYIGQYPVCLRNYDGKVAAPTLKLKPGDALRVTTHNDLPSEAAGNPCSGYNPADFKYTYNVTNLHTHGLHVSPAGNADNVLLSVNPGENFVNEYLLPEDHPSGSFWYHAHHHESTAIQVGSGMAGAIIVEGGLDDVPEIAAAEDNIFVFEQIPFDENGLVETYDVFGPRTWEASGRHTSINGLVWPILTAKVGEVQRWRFIHAGVREMILAKLCRFQSGCPTPMPMHEIAEDGIALGRIDTKTEVELEPGYRSDVLVKFDKPGFFVLVDEAVSGGLQGFPEEKDILAWVYVDYYQQNEMPLPTETQVASLAPFAPIAAEEVTDYQRVEFNIRCMKADTSIGNCPNIDGESYAHFSVNERVFNMDNPPRTIERGGVTELTLTSRFVNHPFHIHVNPFYVIKHNGIALEHPVWKDTLMVNAPTGDQIEAAINAAPQPISSADLQQALELDTVIRLRAERYIGDTVLHCHILDHEDEGMMQKVRFADSSGSSHE